MSNSGIESSATPVIGACYLLTNSNDPADLGKYFLANGEPLFNIGILFAANVNGTADQPLLFLNETVTKAVTSGIVATLQQKGIKIVLSLLGNHTSAGISGLTNDGPQILAKQLADAVNQYGLDGIDFDDEWSNETPNPSSFPLLVSALRDLLPDKILSFYCYGPAAWRLSYEGIEVGELLDYSWNPIYSTFDPPAVPGLSNSQLSPAAIGIDPDDSSSFTPEESAVGFATSTMKGGYGAFMYYNLPGEDISSYLSAISGVLYGQKTVYDDGTASPKGQV